MAVKAKFPKNYGDRDRPFRTLQPGTVTMLIHWLIKPGSPGKLETEVGVVALSGSLRASGSVIAACPVHWEQYLKRPLA